MTAKQERKSWKPSVSTESVGKDQLPPPSFVARALCPELEPGEHAFDGRPVDLMMARNGEVLL